MHTVFAAVCKLLVDRDDILHSKEWIHCLVVAELSLMVKNTVMYYLTPRDKKVGGVILRIHCSENCPHH